MEKPCPNCGTPFDPLQGKYAPNGTVVCVPCGERFAAAVVTAQKQSSASAFPGSFGALLIALLSFFVEHRLISFLFPLVAIVGGAGTALTALRSARAVEGLGWKRWPTVVIGAVAAALGVVSLGVG